MIFLESVDDWYTRPCPGPFIFDKGVEYNDESAGNRNMQAKRYMVPLKQKRDTLKCPWFVTTCILFHS
jgi:hypothetical protein